MDAIPACLSQSCHERWNSYHKFGPLFTYAPQLYQFNQWQDMKFHGPWWPFKRGVLMMRSLMITSPSNFPYILYSVFPLSSYFFLTNMTIIFCNFIVLCGTLQEDLDLSTVPLSAIWYNMAHNLVAFHIRDEKK